LVSYTCLLIWHASHLLTLFSVTFCFVAEKQKEMKENQI